MRGRPRDCRESTSAGECWQIHLKQVGLPRALFLTDACLVRMSELTSDGIVLTLDGDFRIYRRHGKQKIALRIPSDRSPFVGKQSGTRLRIVVVQLHLARGLMTFSRSPVLRSCSFILSGFSSSSFNA